MTWHIVYVWSKSIKKLLFYWGRELFLLLSGQQNLSSTHLLFKFIVHNIKWVYWTERQLWICHKKCVQDCKFSSQFLDDLIRQVHSLNVYCNLVYWDRSELWTEFTLLYTFCITYLKLSFPQVEKGPIMILVPDLKLICSFFQSEEVYWMEKQLWICHEKCVQECKFSSKFLDDLIRQGQFWIHKLQFRI